MQYKAHLGYYYNGRHFSKSGKKVLSLLVLFSISLSLILSPFVRLPAYADENTNLAKIGVTELKDPDYYPTKNNSIINEVTGMIGVDSTPTPTQTFEFDGEIYGFSLELTKGDAFKNNFFKVEFPTGEISEEYQINPNDAFFGDTEIDQNKITTSELYLFTKMVKKVFIYGDSEVEFAINTTGQDSEVLKTITSSASTDEFSSPTAEITYKEALFNNLGFNLVTREEWGGPTESAWSPTIADVNRIVVHHTATSVDMSNPKNTVKAIYDYHKIRCNTNVGTAPTSCAYADTWQDIGYNYLIDPYGNIYEGRAGGNGTVGAHAVPNTGSIGISK